MSKKSFGGSSIFAIIGLVFIAVIGIRTISTPEIWTHLAQGRANAPLSWLEMDSAVNTTWLYDKLAYTFWNIGGAPLLIILNIIGLVAAFALLVQVSKKWGGGLSQGFALLIAGHLVFQTLDVGPQVAMALFMALFLFIFSKVKNPVVLFATLIPLQLLWTNMHGSFLFGPIIAGLAAAQTAQNNKGLGARNKNQGVESGSIGLLAVILLVVTVANPSLVKLHGQVFANVASPAPAYWSSLFIEYYQVPALKPLVLFVMILGAGGLITLKKKLPITLTTLAIIGAFLAFTSPKQHAFLFAILAFPFIVLSLSAISEYLHASFSNLLGKNDKILIPATGAALVVLIAASILPVVTNQAYVKTGSASNFGLGAQENLYPDGAEAILTHPAFPKKAINLPADGGYLAFKYQRACFLDYRPGRYDTELLGQITSVMLGDGKAYDSLYLEYRPEAFIINTLTPASAQGVVTLLRRDIWKLAYFDGTTAIILQDKPEFADLLNDTAAQNAGLAKLEKARADFAALNGASRGGNSAELIGSGKVFLAFNRPVEAKAIFSLILQGNAKSPGAWIGLGNSQLLLKEFDAAIKSLQIATEQAPNSYLAWNSYAVACKYAGQNDEFQQAVEKLEKLAARNQSDEEPADEAVAPAETKTKSLTEMTVPSE